MDEILTQEELAEKLKVTTNTIRRWSKEHGLPKANLPGSARYVWSEVCDWLKDHSREGKHE